MMSNTFLSPGIDESLVFPDGQPHIRLASPPDVDAVTCRIACAADLLRVAMLADVMRRNRPHLRILYLMGARMDRSLSTLEPYTLRVVCDLINSMGFPSVTVFCPHSQSVGDLLDRYEPYASLAEDCFFDMSIIKSARVMHGIDYQKHEVRGLDSISLVFPDYGAQKRFAKSELMNWYPACGLVTLSKDRNERTGKILGTSIVKGQPTKTCVIIDDLCDGGATFIAAANVLRESGAEHIALAVCHGVFSKGTTLPGIDYICTTNSFCERESAARLWVHNFC